jgi:ribosome biogenesis GTPase
MEGLIMRTTGSWYNVRSDEDGSMWQCRLRGKFKIILDQKKTTNPIAVGDRVVWETENENEKTGLITDILPRDNYIIRKSVHKKTAHSHILAANIEQAILIATLAYPRTSLGFVDRFLVTAESFDIPARIIFNKTDLLEEEGRTFLDELKNIYEPLGYPCLFTSTLTGEGIDEFHALLKGKISLLSGHSGVGKTSLVNTISPSFNLPTKEVSDFAEKGVHTTTFAEMFELEPDTFIIDAPGIKELGLVEMAKEELHHFFPEMSKRFGECKYYNCLHLNEPDCAILHAVEKGEIASSRYSSYLSMIEGDDNRR